jgi:hypothetical protein
VTPVRNLFRWRIQRKWDYWRSHVEILCSFPESEEDMLGSGCSWHPEYSAFARNPLTGTDISILGGMVGGLQDLASDWLDVQLWLLSIRRDGRDSNESR